MATPETQSLDRSGRRTLVPADPAAPLGIERRYTRPGSTRSTRSSGSCATRSSRARTARRSSSAGVEFPVAWSQTATNIVAQKYFRGQLNTPERERSVRQMIGRVADTITAVGAQGRLLRDDAEADAFHAELKHLLLHQMAAFNSPVWFNVGLRGAAAVLARASSSPSTTRWTRSSTGSPRRAASSAAARGRGSTSRSCARRRSSCRRAATPPGRSRSCAGPMHRPARSSRAARRGARPRWSCSTSTTPTSRSSSGARRARRRRRARSRRPATTCRSTRRTGPRSSTRTRTTRCA